MTSPESNQNDPLHFITTPDNPNNFGPGSYVRWRPRMVRQSVYDDMVNTLERANWPVIFNGKGTATSSNFKLTAPVNVIEYFPEEGFTQDHPVLLNTLALDNGLPGPLEEEFLGGLFSRVYRFSLAFYAESDSIALALMSDLADRYLGLADSPFITLYDFAHATPKPIVRMECEQFHYTRAPDAVAPWEKHLFLAMLEITDYVTQTEARTF